MKVQLLRSCKSILLSSFLFAGSATAVEKVAILPPSVKRLLIRAPLELSILHSTSLSLQDSGASEALNSAESKIRNVALENNVNAATESSEATVAAVRAIETAGEPGEGRRRLGREISRLRSEVLQAGSDVGATKLRDDLSSVAELLVRAEKSLK